MTELWDDPRITAFGMLVEGFAAVMSQVERDLDAATGMPVTWFEVLLRLARSPQHQLRMAELAKQVGLSTSGLTRLVDRIEEAGYVRRESCPNDRRGANAVLTDEGERVLQQAVPSHLESIDAHVVAPLGGDIAVLERVMRALRDANGPGQCPGS